MNPLLAARRLAGRSLRALPTLPTDLRRRGILERDLAKQRRRHRSAFQSMPTGGRPALFASLSSFTYQVKLESMLGTALRLEGYEPVVLVSREAKMARRYFRTYGIERFVELESFIDPRHAADAEDEAGRLLAGVESVEDLKAVEYNGAAVGRQVLATVSRSLFQGALDLADPDTRRRVESLLPTAIQWTRAADALLTEVDPEVVLFLEKSYAYYGPLFDRAIARDLNVIQFVGAYQDDRIAFKRYTEETKSVHPRSLSDDSWSRVRSMPWTPERDQALDRELDLRYGSGTTFHTRNQAWTKPVEREELVRTLDLDPEKKNAVLFSHVLWDANVFYGEDLFPDQGRWFIESVRAACANDSVNWIIKLHPANVSKLAGSERELDEVTEIREQIGELPPHVKLLRPESTIAARSIFAITDWGITIRGSIGVELPCFGIPVITGGTGYYSGRGFTIDPPTTEAYLELLRNIDEVPPLTAEQTELARRHAYALFILRGMPFDSFKTTAAPVGKTTHPLELDIEIRPRSAADLRDAKDLRAFARWATRTRALDYLDLDNESSQPSTGTSDTE
jgi:hypothetical protein